MLMVVEHVTLQRSMVPLDRVAAAWAHVAEATAGATLRKNVQVCKDLGVEAASLSLDPAVWR